MKFKKNNLFYCGIMVVLLFTSGFPQNLNQPVIHLAGEGLFGGKVVKNSPFVAEFETENVQVIEGSNRIVQKATSIIYRNSDGKLRHDQTFIALQALAGRKQPQNSIIIFDTPAGFYYNLDFLNKVAYRQKVYQSEENIPELQNNPQALIGVSATPISGVGSVDSDGQPIRGMPIDAPKSESLGSQNILGIDTEGVRYIFTIPAGLVGNERPIQTVSENWYSKELQTIIMSKTNDPRFGEYTFKLTKFSRNEPAPQLFGIPSEFRIVNQN